MPTDKGLAACCWCAPNPKRRIISQWRTWRKGNLEPAPLTNRWEAKSTCNLKTCCDPPMRPMQSNPIYLVALSLYSRKYKDLACTLPFSLFPCMDQITVKTPNPKCSLYWCLIEFIDWRYSQSCWYFRPLL